MWKMLPKFRKYESKLILFFKLIDKKIHYSPKNIHKKLCYVSLHGYKNLIIYCNLKYHQEKSVPIKYWNITELAKGGHRNLIDYFASISDINSSSVSFNFWYRGLCGAIRGNHKDIMQYCILMVGPANKSICMNLTRNIARYNLERYFEDYF